MMNKKYTAKDVENISTKEITNFIRRYNSTVTRLNRENPNLGIARMLPKLTREDILLNTFEYGGKEKTVIKKLSTNREVAAKLNEYSELFNKNNQKVVKFGEVETVSYIKKRVKKQEQKIRRREKAGKEKYAIKNLEPKTKDELQKGLAIRENKVAFGRDDSLAELYKLNYFKGVKKNTPKWVGVFYDMLSGVSGQAMHKYAEEDPRLNIDFTYSEFEADIKANYILQLWAEKLNRSYTPPAFFKE